MILTLSFREFKENCEHNVIADYQRKENDLIYIYCLEKDIYTKKEKDRLPNLCYKHGLCYDMKYWQARLGAARGDKSNFNETTYISTHIFSFKKKKVDSFFFKCITFNVF